MSDNIKFKDIDKKLLSDILEPAIKKEGKFDMTKKTITNLIRKSYLLVVDLLLSFI